MAFWVISPLKVEWNYPFLGWNEKNDATVAGDFEEIPLNIAFLGGVGFI